MAGLVFAVMVEQPTRRFRKEDDAGEGDESKEDLEGDGETVRYVSRVLWWDQG